MKGKEVRLKPHVVDKQDIIEVPEDLLIAETELVIDVKYVEGEAFLHAMDRKIKYKSVLTLGTTNKATRKDLAQAIRKVIQLYNRGHCHFIDLCRQRIPSSRGETLERVKSFVQLF